MIKTGVDLRGLKPQMAIAYTIACALYQKHTGGMASCVITSASDGKHGPNSLHYSGHALDLRTNTVMPEVRPLLIKELRWALGEQFDAVLESDHIHIEFDPKDELKEGEA